MNVLAIGAHPDDLEIGCGGTLARYAKEGHSVYIAHVCNGDLGHKVIKPEELREIRTREAERSGAVLGAEKVFNIDIGDCAVRCEDREAIRRIIEVIREVRPDLIITHCPDDYMEDHIQVSKLVFEASFSSTLPNIFDGMDSPACDLIPPLYYMDTLAGHGFLPDEYVDITDYIDVKLEALNCHISQIKWMKDHDHIDFLEFVRSCSRFRGIQSGVQYAEAFKVCKAWPRVITKRLLP